MNPGQSFPIRWFVFVCALLPALGRSDELEVKGQEILEKNQHAIVTVEVALKASYSTGGQAPQTTESKYELTGTIIDSSGLTVLALSGCEPTEFYKRAMPQYSAYKIESSLSDLKILLDDNTELPAEIVLRDKDLDLAFIRPKSPPPATLTIVDLNKGSSAKLLEQVITLNRLNSASGRAYSAAAERIIAVISKPRPFYLHDGSMTGSGLGCPVFSLNGNILGIIVMRVGPGGAAGTDYRQNSASVIVPAAEVLKAARQAPPVKGEPEKKETANQAKDNK
jgi:hypothetical protein